MNRINEVEPGTVRDHDQDRLVVLLTRQRDLCVQLAKLAESQRSLITGDEPERLLEVLAKRQGLLDEVTAVSQQIRPYQQNWPEVRSKIPEETSREVDQLIKEVHDHLSNILAEDREDAQLLSARKSSTSQALGKIKTHQQAGAAYTAVAAYGPSSMEWTSE